MLFFLGQNPYFPSGTLIEIEDGPLLTLPDRGDGVSATLERAAVAECPPFAENVPPGQCPVVVTSFAISQKAQDIAVIEVDESIHFQVLVIPRTVESVVVNDRARSVEVDSYYPSGGSDDTEFRLHIGHLRPGFYEAMIAFSDKRLARLTFIKFFPARFSADFHNSSELAAMPSEIRELITVSAYETNYESEMLNKALELATEWGENFRKPINDRIRVFYPDLSDDEIDSLTALAREAESYIYALGERELAGEIREGDIPKLAIEKYTWLNKHNVSRLTGIGMYYARK